MTCVYIYLYISVYLFIYLHMTTGSIHIPVANRQCFPLLYPLARSHFRLHHYTQHKLWPVALWHGLSLCMSVGRNHEFGWQRGVVVSGVRRMNEVNARWARSVPGWVIVFGRVYHLGM